MYCLPNFNSIKVRLKLLVIAIKVAIYALFQFHKGTIKTSRDFVVPVRGREFQFHKGTIKTHRSLRTF